MVRCTFHRVCLRARPSVHFPVFLCGSPPWFRVLVRVRHDCWVSGIYDDPQLYQIACAYRDISSEVDALLAWAARHWPVAGGGPSAVLELAAGPAGHALELARRGLRSTALDINPAMCSWASERAAQAGLALEVIEADMRDFKLTAGPG